MTHLLTRGADPQHRDPIKDLTALDWCRRGTNQVQLTSDHQAVEDMLSVALDRG